MNGEMHLLTSMSTNIHIQRQLLLNTADGTYLLAGFRVAPSASFSSESSGIVYFSNLYSYSQESIRVTECNNEACQTEKSRYPSFV